MLLHVAHVAEPVTLLKVPKLHTEQDDDAMVEEVPTGHSEQPEEALAEFHPALHA